MNTTRELLTESEFSHCNWDTAEYLGDNRDTNQYAGLKWSRRRLTGVDGHGNSITVIATEHFGIDGSWSKYERAA